MSRTQAEQDFADAGRRLCSAIGLLEDAWNSSPGIQEDLVPEYEHLQAWQWVPSLYSINEQSLKLLVGRCGRSYRKKHQIRPLYDRLNPDLQDFIQTRYQHYREIHDYLPEFLEFVGGIDSGIPNGYTVWRYFILEGFSEERSRRPVVHVGALFELARTLRELIESFACDSGSIPALNPIGKQLAQSFLNSLMAVSREHGRKLMFQSTQPDDHSLGEAYCTELKRSRDCLRANLQFVIEYLKTGDAECMPPRVADTDQRTIMRIWNKFPLQFRKEFVYYVQNRELFDVHWAYEESSNAWQVHCE